MEFSKFISIIKKHRYGLMAIPALVMLITFMLVRHQPDVYGSKSRLAAGIADGSQQLLGDRQGMQESKVNQTFSNLIQVMQLKVVYDEVSYQLILHDISSEVPFRKRSALLLSLNPSALKHASQVFAKKYNDHEPLYLTDPDQKGLQNIVSSMKYDDESLRNKLKVYRVDNSDFIDIEFESEDPALSAFVVNTLCKEFINYYSSITKQNGLKAIDFLGDLLNSKKDSLNAKMQVLKNFKIQNRVLNLNEQAKSLYAQMSDFETRLDLTEKEVQSNMGAIKSLDDKLNSNDRDYIESKMSHINQQIVDTKEKLTALNDAYIKSNFDDFYRQKIDSLKDLLVRQVNQSSDKYITNPASTKDNLVAQRLKLEIDLSLARSSIKTLQEELDKLNTKFDKLVPNEAVIQSYESDINVASQEYIEILKKFNQTSMEFNSTIKLKQVEPASPGAKQPSKKIILVVLSGIVSVVFYLVVLFILFYLDDSIRTAVDLANKTNDYVIGFLPLIRTSYLDIHQLWDKYNEQPLIYEFKKLLRSVRFEIDMAMSGSRVLAITSMTQAEGKTLLALSLASSYQMVNKRVLLIDGNFEYPDLTEITNPKYLIEDYLSGKTPPGWHENESGISVLGNKGNDISLFEIRNEITILAKLMELKDIFDIIIIDTPALNTLNQSKEWLVVADKTVVVFEANRSIVAGEDEYMGYLKELKGKFIGWVLNKVANDVIKTKRFGSFFKKNPKRK